MNATTLTPSQSDLIRFNAKLLAKPEHPDACWEWDSAASYRFWFEGETRYPHIVAWRMTHGEIPTGRHVLRQCGNPRCCRVSHMKLGHANQTTDENLEARFLEKTCPGEKVPHMDTPCTYWSGSLDVGGYGVMRVGRKQKKTHQVAWYLKHRIWILRPDLIMHKCDVRKCVNIEHLDLGDWEKNRADCVRKKRHAKGPTHGSRTKPQSVPTGVKNGRAKLKESDVVQIRLTFNTNANAHGICEGLARRYGLDASTIRDIVTFKLWPNVKIEDYSTIKPLLLSDLKFGHTKGETSPHAKFSDAIIRAILLEYGQASKKHGMLSKLARQFNISTSHVHRIVNGKAR